MIKKENASKCGKFTTTTTEKPSLPWLLTNKEK